MSNKFHMLAFSLIFLLCVLSWVTGQRLDDMHELNRALVKLNNTQTEAITALNKRLTAIEGTIPQGAKR